MRYVTFQCYAPLVSWGEIAVGGERHSARHPSKSAIIGLIAAALGIRRNDEQGLQTLTKAVGFAVKMFSGGTVLKDFHTVQIPKPDKKFVYQTRRDELLAPDEKIRTVLSRREYRCDAFSVVTVWLKNGTLTLEEIAQALKTPVFQLYLGRKSCPPALPLNPTITTAETLRDAFEQYDLSLPTPLKVEAPDWMKENYAGFQRNSLREKEAVSFYWEKCDHAGFDEMHKTQRYDVPHSRKRWQFTPRDEYFVMKQQKEAPDVSE